jgi:serine/threonine protein kinase
VRWLSDKTLDHLRQLADAPDLSGTKYEVIEKIGQGGMGSVYLARDRDLDRVVALKVLDLPAADERLVQEARIIARLEHPGIVPVHDVGTLPDGRVFYVMKLVRGKRLDEQGASSLSEKLQVFEKVCQAVAFAHSHGVLHRDLKPQNIMVGAFGEVLVMDWGIAKILRGPAPADHVAGSHCPGDNGPPNAEPVTGHGQVVGTPGYMSPEQARGNGAGLDERVDVYALGGILYFLLTGTAPADGQRPPPRRLAPAVPRPLEAVCLKALAAEPSQRYSSVADLSAEIARFLAGARVAAYPESIFGTIRRFLANYRAAVILILAYLVLRILLLIFAGA